MLPEAPRAPRALALAAYLAAVIAFLLLQEVGLRLRREEHRAWWAGSGRDLLNVAGVLCLGGALGLLGLGWPQALLVGGTLTLALFGISVFVATQTGAAHPRRWSVPAGLAVALALLAFLAEVTAAFDRLAGALFRGAAG